MRLNRKRLENGTHFIINNKFELYLTLEGYYRIENIKTGFCYSYSNYSLMRRHLTELMN